MSWITEPEINSEAVEEAARRMAAEKPERPRSSGGGRMSPIMSVMSLNPRALKGVRDMNSAITFGASVLTRVQEEAIATTVAAANHCRF
jgi:alkylhydroperoxidase family enzyme